MNPVNDGSSRPPRLVCYAHTWGLLELPRLPHDRAWTFDAALDRVVEAGYDGVQGEPERGEEIRARGLRFAGGGRANTVQEADELVQRATDNGAECVTVHLGWGDETDAEQDALVTALLTASDRYATPAYIETHRATILQDLYRTCRLIERIPEIRFNADLSHYYCSHEAPYRGFEAFSAQLEPVLQRSCFFHGRVSNGQAIQVSVNGKAHAESLSHFKTLWETAMREWIARARPGDLLPFVPELGPPSSGYAITREVDGRIEEIADRWAESLTLASIAKEVFARASV